MDKAEWVPSTSVCGHFLYHTHGKRRAVPQSQGRLETGWAGRYLLVTVLEKGQTQRIPTKGQREDGVASEGAGKLRDAVSGGSLRPRAHHSHFEVPGGPVFTQSGCVSSKKG